MPGVVHPTMVHVTVVYPTWLSPPQRSPTCLQPRLHARLGKNARRLGRGKKCSPWSRFLSPALPPRFSLLLLFTNRSLYRGESAHLSHAMVGNVPSHNSSCADPRADPHAQIPNNRSCRPVSGYSRKMMTLRKVPAFLPSGYNF